VYGPDEVRSAVWSCDLGEGGNDDALAALEQRLTDLSSQHGVGLQSFRARRTVFGVPDDWQA
jgi:hypothetical protein